MVDSLWCRRQRTIAKGISLVQFIQLYFPRLRREDIEHSCARYGARLPVESTPDEESDCALNDEAKIEIKRIFDSLAGG